MNQFAATRPACWALSLTTCAVSWGPPLSQSIACNRACAAYEAGCCLELRVAFCAIPASHVSESRTIRAAKSAAGRGIFVSTPPSSRVAPTAECLLYVEGFRVVDIGARMAGRSCWRARPGIREPERVDPARQALSPSHVDLVAADGVKQVKQDAGGQP